jgi:hypothetical protein
VKVAVGNTTVVAGAPRRVGGLKLWLAFRETAPPPSSTTAVMNEDAQESGRVTKRLLADSLVFES